MTMIPLPVWAIVFCVAIVLSGCAPVPVCEGFEVRTVTVRGQPFFLLDDENATKMAEMMRGLNEGKCHLEIPQ